MANPFYRPTTSRKPAGDETANGNCTGNCTCDYWKHQTGVVAGDLQAEEVHCGSPL